jgi:hypothetical protein
MQKNVDVRRVEGDEQFVSQMTTGELFQLLSQTSPAEAAKWIAWAANISLENPEITIEQGGQITLKGKLPSKEEA